MTFKRPVIHLSVHSQNTYEHIIHTGLAERSQELSHEIHIRGGQTICCGAADHHSPIMTASDPYASSFRLGEGFIMEPLPHNLVCINAGTSPLENPHLLAHLKQFDNPLIVVTDIFLSACVGSAIHLTTHHGMDCYVPLDLVSDGTHACPAKLGSRKFLDYNMDVLMDIAAQSNPNRILMGSMTHLLGLSDMPLPPQTKKKGPSRPRKAKPSCG